MPPEEHMPHGVELRVALRGAALTPAQRERLLRAAERCPVKRMLAGQMPGGVNAALVAAA